jgi:hypothetical protein
MSSIAFICAICAALSRQGFEPLRARKKVFSRFSIAQDNNYDNLRAVHRPSKSSDRMIVSQHGIDPHLVSAPRKRNAQHVVVDPRSDYEPGKLTEHSTRVSMVGKVQAGTQSAHSVHTKETEHFSSAILTATSARRR